MPYGTDTDIQGALATWGPRVLGAVAVLVLAWLVARGVQWALGKAIDKIPGAATHNAGRPPKETIGRQLGSLGYWLVLLIGVIAAVSVLQLPGLTSAVGPLNVLVTDVAHFVPKLIGAVVIFFIGYIIATLARRVVEAALGAASLDRIIQHAGLGRVTGAAGIAKTAGIVVFVLILIPAAIAALQQLGVAAISEPAIAVLRTVLDALPRLIGAAIVLAIAFAIARWVASLIEQILPSLGFDRTIQGMMGSSAPPAMADAATAPAAQRVVPSKIVAHLAMWAIMLFSAVEAARLLNFGAIALMLQQVLELGTHVLFGAVIITAGVIIAQFLADLINRSTQGRDGFASTLVRWATIALATAMGLRFMGIADEIVILAFGLILGSASVAAALAFGLGGREAAGRLADRWARKAEQQSSPTDGGV